MITQRLEQLEHRKIMIPRYVRQPGKFLGKKDFCIEDLPQIEADIQECKAALKGIEQITIFTQQPEVL